MDMRVLVCGGRNFTDKVLLETVLDELKNANQVDCIIEGNARGADRLAGYWARKNKIDNIKFPARWDLYGNAAGPIRNQLMIDEGKPDYVIAFKGNKGTQDMIDRVLKANISVELI